MAFISDNSKTIIRSATEQDRQRLANRIYLEPYVHRHLDWHSPLDWIGRRPFLLAERDAELMAALACPPDPPDVAWIRLFMAIPGDSLRDLWLSLWQPAQNQLAEQGVTKAVVIPLQSWFTQLLQDTGFQLVHQVMVLSWQNPTGRLTENPASVQIRPMTLLDLDRVVEVDAAAFAPIWQNSRETLDAALLQAAQATVILARNEIVGYQISTSSPMGGHLARLAIHPDWQRQHLGYYLLLDLISRFQQSGIWRITVNTQGDNEASLQLYRKVGFCLTGESYEVYQAHIKIQ